MNDRDAIARHLTQIELDLKNLVVRYEQYFSAAEKREPLKDREDLAARIRALANRQLVQTDLRFKFQSLATRFHSYAGYWDRILRLMDEGKYRRPPSQTGAPPARKASEPREETSAEVAALHRDLLEAHRKCHLKDKAPDLSQVEGFLAKQRSRIREKFGEREVEFRVVTEEGKPKIRVRAKNSEE